MPGFFYFFLKTGGTNQYIALPYYGTSESGQDAGALPAVSLLNATGNMEQVPFPDSTISVINFFYTQCPQFCGRMNTQVLYLADRFSKSALINFYSLSLDRSDTPETLKNYIRANGFARHNWHFYTGRDSGIARLSSEWYQLDAIRDTTNNSIIHTPLLVLLDADNYIRGYYDATNKKDIERLQDELMVLLTETRRKKELK